MRRSGKVIVLTGGGSGGHITPIVAVADEVKRLQPRSKLVYIGQTGDALGEVAARANSIDEAYTIRAGKFRRYHNEGLKQLLDLPTLFMNIRDFFFVIIGIFQSRRLLKRLQPDAIFIKGGFVGVPVGLAAANLHIPYITHDSDAIPGLANRIIGRWADWHAVALPAETYDYPASRTITTGIPLRQDFVRVTTGLQATYRKGLGLPEKSKVLFVVGGGLGGQRVNAAVANAVPHLLNEFRDLQVIQIAGKANEVALKRDYIANLSEAEQGRLRVSGFAEDIYKYSGAADVIITRAGATNLAEFAQQGKACVIIPSPFLTGGHQLKNAQYLADQDAALVIDETELTDDPNRLAKQISQLFNDDRLRQKLAKHMAAFAKPDAAHDLAELILSTAGNTRHSTEASQPESA